MGDSNGMANHDGGKAWTEAETSDLVQLVSDGTDYGTIADSLTRTIESCRSRARTLGLKHPKASRPWSSEEMRAASVLDWPSFRKLYPDKTPGAYQDHRSKFRKQIDVPSVRLTDFTKIVHEVEGDSLVAACVHVPQTDPVMWGKMLAIGERDKIPTLIVAGDIVVADMFSHWPADGVSDSWAFNAELESLKLHLKQALNVFEYIDVLPGNHVGHRIVRISNGHIRLGNLITMAGLNDAERSRIATTDMDYVTLKSGGEEFLIAHSTNYASRGGSVPVDYAEINEKHVIAGNGHIYGHQVSKSGKYHGFELGTVANPNYMGYAQRALTKFPKMQQSFLTVRNGAVKVYGAGLPVTDWSRELAE